MALNKWVPEHPKMCFFALKKKKKIYPNDVSQSQGSLMIKFEDKVNDKI